MHIDRKFAEHVFFVCMKLVKGISSWLLYIGRYHEVKLSVQEKGTKNVQKNFGSAERRLPTKDSTC